MSLAGIAKSTVQICERGVYTAPSGRVVDISAEIAAAREGTHLFRPGDFDALWWPSGVSAPRTTVTEETTGAACRRLAGAPGLAALVFASARNPGGGFLGGAKAQEEDLARVSALYPCQLTARPYYDANRATSSLLYTDHLILSPNVPFFRDERLDLLEHPFAVTLITSPAPNAGEAKRRGEGGAVRAALRRRAGQVLAVAAASGVKTLVLGAWGCGVFQNDPEEVARAFALHLGDPRFAGVFEEVVFAIAVRGKRDEPNLAAFRAVFDSHL